MTCTCNEAKIAYITLNRLNLATNIGILCLKCEKIWTIKEKI